MGDLAKTVRYMHATLAPIYTCVHTSSIMHAHRETDRQINRHRDREKQRDKENNLTEPITKKKVRHGVKCLEPQPWGGRDTEA